MKRKWTKLGIISFLSIILILTLVASGCAATPEVTKDKIKVGFAISLSGIYAAASESQLNPYLMWGDQVNERGGIYVKDIDKTLPVELVYYDNKSTSEDTIKVYERLITTDKVDILFGPWGTTVNIALTPTIAKYSMPLVANTASPNFEQRIGTGNYFFWTWPPPEITGADMVDMLSAHKDDISTVAVLYVSDLYPLTYGKTVEALLREEGFDIVLFKDFPIGVTDLSEVLLDIKSKNADALIVGSYPADTILIVKQSIELGVNLKLFGFLIGPGIIGFEDIFGTPDVIDGVIMEGPWHFGNGAPGSLKFYNDFKERFGTRPDITDSAFVWASAQVMEQAIEKAGTLDPDKVRDAIATGTFDTILGTLKFDGQETLQFHGFLQWQEGVIEAAWPLERATAEVIFPKPDWPK